MGISFKLKTFENVGYNAVGKVIIVIFQLAANVILARNLISSDYGIVGFAMIFITFLSQFGDMGIQTAVIQAGDLGEKEIYTGFTIKAALGMVTFAAALILSPLAGFLFDNAAVGSVVKVLSLNFAISSFVFLPNVLLTRELNYRKLFIPQVGSAVVNSTLSIILAWSGFSYWSIVLANICSTVVSVIIFNIVKPVRICFRFDREKALEFMRFGGNLFFSGMIVFFIFNVDNFAIGTVKGANALGYYAVAFNWGSMICVMLGGIVLSVLFPTFSKMQDDRQRMRKAYLQVLEYVSFIGLLANIGLLAVSKDFLFFVLGRGTEKWLPALTSLRILCLYGVFRLLLEPVGSVILAMGKTGPLLRAQIIMAVVELVLLYPALYFFGIEGVAVAVTVSYVLAFAALFPLLRKELGLSLAQWVAPALPAVSSAITALVALSVVQGFIPFTFAGMVTKVVILSCIYFATYGMITKWKIVGEIRDVVAEFRLRSG